MELRNHTSESANLQHLNIQISNIYFILFSIVLNIQRLSFLEGLFSLALSHFDFGHPVNETHQPLQHRRDVLLIEIDDHSHSQGISTELVDIADVDKLHTFAMLHPSRSLFFTVEKMSDMIYLFDQQAVSVRHIKLDLGFLAFVLASQYGLRPILLAKLLDIGV